jgi:hypothetical protein
LIASPPQTIIEISAENQGEPHTSLDPFAHIATKFIGILMSWFSQQEPGTMDGV